MPRKLLSVDPKTLVGWVVKLDEAKQELAEDPREVYEVRKL